MFNTQQPANSIIPRFSTLPGAIAEAISDPCYGYETFSFSALKDGLSLYVQQDCAAPVYRVEAEDGDIEWIVTTSTGLFRAATSMEYRALENNYETGYINPVGEVVCSEPAMV